ncbi:MAG: DUF420 domain-containing protein [Gammaproteobacteria bacterium]|nr:DUF420 domain-containing protein [Gammaproteobacteria bacterium]MCW8909255.1 DUF420 domain-containing protein [Gammaproteobacteria bacterium]MCW9005607.1 DUF420 domain-containing protein [Gammaproteobacteria bacterium]MCW9056400.1 DUF420 domain-containing protein [Gammaproteobacteria bacterium]
MDIIPYLPTFQAILNFIAAIIITTGYFYIRNNNRVAHRRCMIGALVTSGFFLVSYFYYHWTVGNVPFAGQGIIRPIYFSILFTHVVLALSMLALVPMTVSFAIKGDTVMHKKFARVTLPIWLYVSITGVIIYLLVFHFYTA